jgi:hypothetical protein
MVSCPARTAWWSRYKVDRGQRNDRCGECEKELGLACEGNEVGFGLAGEGCCRVGPSFERRDPMIREAFLRMLDSLCEESLEDAIFSHGSYRVCDPFAIGRRVLNKIHVLVAAVDVQAGLTAEWVLGARCGFEETGIEAAQ